MAFFPFDGESKPLGRILRTGLDNTRDGRYKLERIKGHLEQMTNAQVLAAFNFSDEVAAGNAKAELLAGIGKLLSDQAGDTGATISAAVLQMLDQFG